MAYVEIDEDFSTKYDTYIVAYCPDTNSWFIVNQRHFYFEFDNEFKTYQEGYDWFCSNIDLIASKQDEILSDCFYHPKKSTEVWLDIEDQKSQYFKLT